MNPTVGRVVHYYDGRGAGPWKADVVEVRDGQLGLYVIPPFGGVGPGYERVTTERLPEEAEAHRHSGIPFWCWPPRS